MQKVNRILIELLPIAPARHTLRLHIIVDSARETDASIPHYRRLRQPDSRARHTDASIRVSFWKKKIGRNRRYFYCKLPPIAPGGRMDTFSISTIINIDMRL